jgi:cytochrome c5
MLKSFLLLSAVCLLVFSPSLTRVGNSQETAPAPEPAPAPTHAGATNPVKPTAESQAKAKGLYQIDCAMCHGDNGNGQTDIAKSMSLTMTDFSDSKTLASSQDGQLFDIIRNGKDKMPPEAAGRANDNMVWNLIIYIRNMSKVQAAK